MIGVTEKRSLLFQIVVVLLNEGRRKALTCDLVQHDMNEEGKEDTAGKRGRMRDSENRSTIEPADYCMDCSSDCNMADGTKEEVADSQDTPPRSKDTNQGPRTKDQGQQAKHQGQRTED